MLPLREVAGIDDPIHIHVPFPLNGYAQDEKCLGSFTSDSTALIKKFQYLTQSYDLTFYDLYMTNSNNLLSEEHRHVWEKAHEHTDMIHQTDQTHLE